MKQHFQILLTIYLLVCIAPAAKCQSDSLKVKTDIAAIRINLLNPWNIGAEFYPALHHSIGIEAQGFRAGNLEMGSPNKGVMRVYLDYRYFFSKKSISGLFLGGYAMYKQQHEVQEFTQPYYHGIQYEARADGLWAGALVGYRKRFPVKIYLSAFLGIAGAVDMKHESIDNTPASLQHIYGKSPFQKSHFAKDVRLGGEIGYLF